MKIKWKNDKLKLSLGSHDLMKILEFSRMENYYHFPRRVEHESKFFSLLFFSLFIFFSFTSRFSHFLQRFSRSFNADKSFLATSNLWGMMKTKIGKMQIDFSFSVSAFKCITILLRDDSLLHKYVSYLRICTSHIHKLLTPPTTISGISSSK